MENGYSSTGVNAIKSNSLKQALIFDDDRCPRCGYKMILDSRQLKYESINVRFICEECGFVCPIYHDESDPNKLSPKYDSSIAEFIDNLGETVDDIRLRMLRML